MKALCVTALLFLLIVSGHGQPSTTCERTIAVVLRTDEQEVANQVVEVPGFPDNYQNDLSCTWVLIAVEPDVEIEVEFDNILTEACCDFIEVRDGPTSDSPLIANIRKNITQAIYMSTFGSLYITFVSDHSITDRAFSFSYRAVLPNKVIEWYPADQLLRSLQSVGYPAAYINNAYHVCLIIAPEGAHVILTIVRYSIESCCDDLQIRDGNITDEDSRLLAVLRGALNRPSTYISTGRIMSVRFRTSAAGVSNGFRAIYRARNDTDRPSDPTTVPPDTVCGGNFTAPAQGHKRIESPNFPNVHAGNLKCVWLIWAAPGKRVKIWFSYVTTERCCDWIIIRDGNSHISPKIGTVSGNTLRFHSFVSTGIHIRIEFCTDHSINSRGFQGYYETYRDESADETRCGGSFVADGTTKYISSPGWPEPYRPNSLCIWVIRVLTLGAKVRLEMLGVITETSQDFVVIFDGDSIRSTRLITLHGKYYRHALAISSGSSLTVAFISNGVFNAGGFRATYTQVLTTAQPSG